MVSYLIQEEEKELNSFEGSVLSRADHVAGGKGCLCVCVWGGVSSHTIVLLSVFAKIY